MSGVSRVVKVAEIDVSDAFVGLLNDPHGNVAVFLVLPVQGVPDDVVRRLRVEGRHAQYFVTASGRGHLGGFSSASAAGTAIRGMHHD